MSQMNVHERLIDLFEAYRDFTDELDDAARRTYRQSVVTSPAGFTAATLAAVLEGVVRFTPSANAAFIRHLDAAGVHPVPLDELRAGIEVTGEGRALVAACVSAGHTDALADALAILFIAAHPDLCNTERPDAPGDQDDDGDGGDDDGDSWGTEDEEEDPW